MKSTMNYTAQLKIPSKNPDIVIESVSLEELNTDRANIDFTKEKEYIIVDIKSKDTVMLRALINTVLRHISVSDKIL